MEKVSGTKIVAYHGLDVTETTARSGIPISFLFLAHQKVCLASNFILIVDTFYGPLISNYFNYFISSSKAHYTNFSHF